MMGLGRSPTPLMRNEDGKMVASPQDPNTPTVVTETDDLRATKLAFILGRRSAEIAGVAGKALRDRNGDPTDAASVDDSLLDYGFQLTINNGFAPGVPGTERFQKLCSFEYLQRYFTNVLCNKGIDLGAFPNTKELRAANPVWGAGLTRAVAAAATARDALIAAAATGAPVGDNINEALNRATMTNVPDLCKLLGMAGSDAATADEPRLQGIFARDQGPFLRGKGVETGLLMGTPSGTTFSVELATGGGDTKQTQPFHVSRCAGDELAFGVLERLMEQKGLTDWRPDGIVLSLGVDDPSDALSNEQLQARDGQLFNVRVQGPAISSSWTGDPALETMPLDKVFVVIVADVWWGELAAGDAKIFVDKVTTGVQPELVELQRYLAARNEALSGDELVTEATLERFREAANAAMQDGNKERTRLCNFRVRLATSSQMINYSSLRFGRDKTQVLGNERMSRDEFVRVPNQSRMGLRLGTKCAEYIVGGWCIGNVLDTSASRGTMPGTGSNIGVRTAPNSMALNINVQIDWWDADRMWRCFMNKEALVGESDPKMRSGSLTPRYVPNAVPDDSIQGINKKQRAAAAPAAAAPAAAAPAAAQAARAR